MRYAAVTGWLVAFGYNLAAGGIPVQRDNVLVWAASGIAALTLGKRNSLTVLVDFVPFALILIAWDYLRGASKSFGMPTWWTPQVRVDRALFLGHESNLWLQEHLKYPGHRWWDVPITLCYVSFFVVPSILAAVLWLRSRREFWRWSLRYMTISFIGFAVFAIAPTAPPWSAARCSAAEVADHPYNPPCMHRLPQRADGGLIGRARDPRTGAAAYVQRTSVGGLTKIGLKQADRMVQEGQDTVDEVAAFPSLHAGAIMLFAMFLWRRVRRRWRPLLAGYAVCMGFTVVYTGDHYVADVLAGWALAGLVTWLGARVERRLGVRVEVPPADAVSVGQ
jgi:membrane-associated phospholipid phosphatase